MEAGEPTPSPEPVPVPSSSPSSSLLRDSIYLVILRAIFFLVSSRYLHSTLNTTLREWSKTDQLLPSSSGRGAARPEGIWNGRDGEYDTEDDTSRAPSGPATPLHAPMSPATEATDPSPSESPRPTSRIELADLTQKLSDQIDNRVNKLHLRHGSSSSTKSGTKELSRVARVLFCFCVAEAATLLSMVALHLADIFDEPSLQFNFYISLHLLLALILFGIPLIQCILLTYRSRESSTVSASKRSISLSVRLAVALIPFGLYCFLFSFIPPYITAIDPTTAIPEDGETPPVVEDQPEGWLAPSLGRLVVLGVVILSGLSGFAAVRTVWNFYEQVRGMNGLRLSNDEVLGAERSLYKVRQDLTNKRDELGRSSPSNAGWLGRTFRDEHRGVRAEIRGLEAMESQILKEIQALKLKKSRQDYGSTVQGKVYIAIGYVFASYCAARVAMCLPALFFTTPGNAERGKGNTNGDWISFLVAAGVSSLGFDLDVGVWSRAISLLLTGVLVLSSLARILQSVSGVIRLTSRTAAAGFLLLSLGQLFSTYIISLLVQLRLALDSSGDEDSLLLSLPDFRVFGRLFDVVFLLSVGSSLLYRFIAMKVTGD